MDYVHHAIAANVQVYSSAEWLLKICFWAADFEVRIFNVFVVYPDGG